MPSVTRSMRWLVMGVLSLGACFSTSVAADGWHSAKSPTVPEADCYVVIPGAAAPPDPSVTYRAIFDANRGADERREVRRGLPWAHDGRDPRRRALPGEVRHREPEPRGHQEDEGDRSRALRLRPEPRRGEDRSGDADPRRERRRGRADRADGVPEPGVRDA